MLDHPAVPAAETPADRLTAAEAAAVAAPVARARGLPNRAYTGDAWARAERDRLLGRTWSCVAFADRVAPRHALPIDLLGLPLVLARDPAGTLRAFHNVCRHRGHRLVGGPCAAKTGFVCPYHHWTYAFDGALKGTPHLGGQGRHDAPGFDRAAHGLVPVPAAEWLGMVFVNLSGDAPPFADFIAPLAGRWRPYAGPDGLARLVPAPTDPAGRLEVRANWKLAAENYLESYHLPFVHPGLNAYSPMADHYNILAGEDAAAWGAGQGSTAFAYAERAGIAFPRFPAWPADRLGTAEYIALYPNVLLGLQCDHAFAMVLTPLAPDRTAEDVRLYFTDAAALGPDHAAARAALLRDWMAVFDEDVAVVEGMQAGRASPAFDGGAFSPVHDPPVHHFHRWVARRMGPAA